ncbi:MAG: cation:proton antiporter [Thermoplasmata archaeon]
MKIEMDYVFSIYGYFFISLLLMLAAIAIPIARKMSVVEIPIFVALGILVGPVFGFVSQSFSVYFFSAFGGVGIGMLGLVIILYSESHNMNLKVLKREFYRIISLDTVGVVITALVSGFFFSFVTGAPFIIGYLFGAIISPTDPVTLIPMFKRINVKEDISEILVGESLFNDPIGIILVSIGIAIAAPESSYVSFFSSIAHMIGFGPGIFAFFIIQITLPGVAGIAIGFTMIALNKKINFENYLTAMLLGVVIFEFTIFESFSITPFPAIIATGAIIGNYSDKSIFWGRERNFNENLAYLAEALIFLLIGTSFSLPDIYGYALFGLMLTIFVVFVARPAAVFPSILAADARRTKGKGYYNFLGFLSLIGPRGVVPIVLSTLPYVIGTEYHVTILEKWGPLISISVLFVVLFSIIIQTIYTPTIRDIFFKQEENSENH